MEDILNSSEDNSGSKYTICFIGNITPREFQNEHEKRQGYTYFGVFDNIYGLIKNSDLTIANLEAPVVDKPESIKKNFKIYSSPSQLIPILKYSGVDAISLANNHSYDHGVYGLQRTRQVLMMNRIEQFGAMDKQSIVRGKFQIFGFTTHINQGWSGYVSRYRRNIENITFMEDKFPIAYVHWGQASEVDPRGDQRYIAADLLRLGFKLIVGHGPHRAQKPWSIFNGIPIIYSLGDFYSSTDSLINEGYILLATFSGQVLTNLERYKIRIKVAKSGATRLAKISREDLV